MNAYVFVLVIGVGLVLLGAFVLLFRPDVTGGTVKAFTVEVDSKGAGVVLIALGLAATALGAAKMTDAATSSAAAATQVPALVAPTIVTPTIAVGASSCSIMIRGGFENLWNSNESIRARLGCAIQTELIGKANEQLFQRGEVYSFTPNSQIFVLDGAIQKWSVYQNIYVNGKGPGSPSVPAGLFAPEKEVGGLWDDTPQLKDDLGWATRPLVEMSDPAMQGAYQSFRGGVMLFSWGLDGQGCRIYVLYEDKSFASFKDGVCGRGLLVLAKS